MTIFAKTRHHYDSYEDFWRLVELSGYQTCFVDEIRIDSDETFIITPMNGELPPHIRNQADLPRLARLILWCLERFDATGAKPMSEAVTEALETVDVVWVSDRWVSTHDARLKYVPFGSHPGLSMGVSGLRQYDFTHQSYAWGRREVMYGILKKMGFKEGPSAWGMQKHEVMAASGLVLNLQQYRDPVTAPIRFALAAAHKLPIVSETLLDPYPLTGLVHTANYDSIPSAVRANLKDPNRAEVAEEIYRVLCEEMTFRCCVEAAL